MTLIPIPAFSDNYLWALHNGQQALVVDPGDAGPMLDFLHKNSLDLAAILVTHHHADHIGGVARLKRVFDCPVYAPDDSRIPVKDVIVGDNDAIKVAPWEQPFQVLHVPGHTLTHVAYVTEGLLFCGDTLFSMGCGRLFEGSPAQMWQSLQRLAALPGDTRVCCAHEYTLSNIHFALAVLPEDPGLLAYKKEVEQRLQAGQPSLPSRIDTERALNPFLNCHREDIRQAAQRHCGEPLADEVAVFACLRQWKDHF